MHTQLSRVSSADIVFNSQPTRYFLGRTFDIDPLWIRLAFVVSVLAGFGLPLIAYFVIALLAD